MINEVARLNKQIIFSRDIQKISPRYSKAVEDIVSKLDSLKENNQEQDRVHKLLKVISEFIKEGFTISDFIKYDYVNLDPEIKEFFGGPGWFKRALDCKYFKTMENLISVRVNYLINRLSQGLTGTSFAPHCINDDYKQMLSSCFGKLVIALYNKGLRNFSSMIFHGIDLSNQAFKASNFYGSSFSGCNLENSNFLEKCDLRWASFGVANTKYMSISSDCLITSMNFKSPADLISIDFTADHKKIWFTEQSSLDEIEHKKVEFESKILIDINKSLDVGEVKKDDPLQNIFTEVLKIDETKKLEIKSKTDGVLLEVRPLCPILLDSIRVEDLCGVRYGRVIQLYSIEALSSTLQLSKKCPFRMSLVYIKKNLLNLNDLKRILL